MSEREYHITYQWITCLTTGKPKLRALLQTDEGVMDSPAIEAVKNHRTNLQLLSTLSDDLIDAYELKKGASQ